MSEKFEIPQELIDSFKEISRIHNAQQRQAVTMLAGFIATQERDLNYMDTYMDPLYDFIEPGSDTEEVIRRYIQYIGDFDPAEAQERIEDLEDTLGYKTRIVYAAGLLASRLHAGQQDKGGNDYFSSHLLKVAQEGKDWKEKVTGFLHDAAEDCNVTVDQVMDMLDREAQRLAEDPAEILEESEWWQPWMDDIMPYPASQTHPITPAEREEIAQTLRLMNHHTAATRQEYIARFDGHPLAIRTKLNDLESNMDISRIPSPTQKDLDRIARYSLEKRHLQEMLWHHLPPLPPR